ncbi:MAG: metallophosphoesterase [Chloroflexi bacterium]|nr:MAG: metallophosphoesterase [Chloroflexota bacterium]
MRVLVLSDIHANLAALDQVLEEASEVDAIWCLGDVVGYGPEPNACVDRLRELQPEFWLAGNHDWAALGKLDISDFNPMARMAALWTRRQLSPENIALLETLPAQVKASELFTLAHGSPRHPIWEYVLDARTAAVNFAYFDTPYCLVGHTHVPAMYRQNNRSVEVPGYSLGEPIQLQDGRMIINPGGVGQPRDGDPRASYLILDTEALTVTYYRVAYPIQETQAKMVEAGLPTRLITRLNYGW